MPHGDSILNDGHHWHPYRGGSATTHHHENGDMKRIGNQGHEAKACTTSENRGKNEANYSHDANQSRTDKCTREKANLRHTSDPTNLSVTQEKCDSHFRQQRRKEVHAKGVSRCDEAGQKNGQLDRTGSTWCWASCFTSVEVWGMRGLNIPVSFRAFVRTLPEVSWDVAQKV